MAVRKARKALATVGVLGLGLVATAAACASSKSAISDNRASSAKQSSVTLTIGDQVSSLKTLLTASGELSGTGYTVKFAEFQGAAPLFQAVKAGAVDTGYAADLPTLTAIAGGVPVKAVAALQSNGAGTAILTQKDSTVTSVADLKGRTVVVSSAAGSVAQELLANVLKKAELSYSDVHVEYLLPTAALAAFNAHKIDVWATFGVYQDTAQLAGARTLVDGEKGLTSGIGLISATGQTLDDPAKKAALQDLLKRVNRALIWTTAHPAQYAADYASAFNLSPAIATQVVSQGSNALVPLSAMEIADIQNVSDVMSAIGGLPTDVSVAAHSDPTAYTAADATSSAKS